MRAFLGTLRAFPQGVSQPFDDGPVEVGPAVDITKTDHGTLGFRSGNLQAG